LGKPTFKQILDALKRQVLLGKSYMGVARACYRQTRLAGANGGRSPLRQNEGNSNNQEHVARPWGAAFQFSEGNHNSGERGRIKSRS
jgi:hypothetical protein